MKGRELISLNTNRHPLSTIQRIGPHAWILQWRALVRW